MLNTKVTKMNDWNIFIQAISNSRTRKTLWHDMLILNEICLNYSKKWMKVRLDLNIDLDFIFEDMKKCSAGEQRIYFDKWC